MEKNIENIETPEANDETLNTENDIKTIEEESSQENSKLGGFGIFMFILFITAIEVAMAYFGYKIYEKSLTFEVELLLGVVAIMGAVFVYFLTLFIEGKFFTFFRNSLLFLVFIASAAVMGMMLLEIDNIKNTKVVTMEDVNKKIVTYEEQLQDLNNQFNNLQAYIKIQNKEHINELTINRKAINAQQKAIQENTRQIQVDKDYRIIKNPF